MLTKIVFTKLYTINFDVLTVLKRPAIAVSKNFEGLISGIKTLSSE